MRFNLKFLKNLMHSKGRKIENLKRFNFEVYLIYYSQNEEKKKFKAL